MDRACARNGKACQGQCSARAHRPKRDHLRPYLLLGMADLTSGLRQPLRYLASRSAKPGSSALTTLALASAARSLTLSEMNTRGAAQVNSMKPRLSFLAASREASP